MTAKDLAYMNLLQAARDLLAQFEAIKEHQDKLLVRGQTLNSASANWDAATLFHPPLDFQPLMDTVAALDMIR